MGIAEIVNLDYLSGSDLEESVRKDGPSIPVRPRDQVEAHEPGVAVAPLGHTVFPIPVRLSAGAYMTGKKVEDGTRKSVSSIPVRP